VALRARPRNWNFWILPVLVFGIVPKWIAPHTDQHAVAHISEHAAQRTRPNIGHMVPTTPVAA
jgi:hypothetical protein